MAKDRVERQLEHLKNLFASGSSESAVLAIRKCLHDKVNVIIAKAAEVVGSWQTRLLLPDLLEAFSNLLDHPEADQQCWGKNAIAKTLKDLEYTGSSHFLRGLYHHQLEPTWGGKTDTAGNLRATCALALPQCTDIPRHEILMHLVSAITEIDPRVRSEAVRALEQVGGRDVQLLLRLKARSGDQEPRVTGQVFESILQIEGSYAVPFVAGFLKHASEEVSEEAILALGTSRLPAAVKFLIHEWTNAKIKHNGAILLRAISASRHDAALDFVLEQVRSAGLRDAEDALRALAIHQDSEEIVRRVEAAVSEREELQALFGKQFKR